MKATCVCYRVGGTGTGKRPTNGGPWGGGRNQGRTDGESKLIECRGKVKNWRRLLWGVLHTSWNGKLRVRGHNTRKRGSGQIQIRDRRGVRGLGEVRKIRLATLNIRFERVEGLEAEIRELNQGNVDMGVLQETKLANGIHIR